MSIKKVVYLHPLDLQTKKQTTSSRDLNPLLNTITSPTQIKANQNKRIFLTQTNTIKMGLMWTKGFGGKHAGTFSSSWHSKMCLVTDETTRWWSCCRQAWTKTSSFPFLVRSIQLLSLRMWLCSRAWYLAACCDWRLVWDDGDWGVGV